MNPASEWIVMGLLRASLGLSLAALAVGACVRLLRPRAPRAEQWAWLIVLAHGVILTPAPVPIPWGSSQPAATISRGPAGTIASDAPGSPAQARREPAGQAVDRQPASSGEPVGSPRSEPAGDGPPAAGPRHSWAAALAAWLAGIVALLGLGVLRYGSFAGRMRRAHPAPPIWLAQWRGILEEQGVAAPIPLLVSQDLGPALCRLPSGYRLVVPEAAWASLDPADRAAILRHELAHYRRGDLWTALLARGLAVAQWFNPLSWWAAARFEAQAEFLCDLVATPGDPTAFAATLMRLASAPRDRIAVGPAARAGSLFERIRRLLTDNPRPPGWRCAAPIAVAVAVLAATAVRLQAVAASDPAAATSSDPAGTTEPRSPLPPRALLRIGTDGLRIRSSFIAGIAFSPDGRLIAAAEANTAVPRVSLFDVRTGRPIRVISPPGRPTGWVQCVAFSPGRTRLAWGEIGGYVAVWDLPGDRLLFREQLHANGVSDVAFSPDGEIIVSGGEDGAVHLRRARDPREVVQRIATGERMPVRRGYTGRPAGMLPVGPIRLAFTPDGSRLIVGSGSSATISVWRVKDGQQDRRIEAAFADPRAGSASLSVVAAMPDGRRVLAAGECTVPIGQTKFKYGPKNVSLTRIGLWDLATGERIRDLSGEETEGRGYAALSRDGRHVAVGDSDVLRILDAGTGRPERSISLPGRWGDRPAFSPDGTLVAMANYNTIALFEVATGRRLHHDAAAPSGEFPSAAWSPTGDRIITGHSDDEVRMWAAGTGKLIWHEVLAPVISPSGSNARPAFLAFSGDGELVVAAGRRDDPVKYDNGIVVVYEASSGRRMREIAAHTWIRWAALADNSRMVVAGTSNGAWDDTHLIGIEVATGRTRWANPPESQAAGFAQLAGLQFQRGSPFLYVAARDGNVIRLNGLTGHEQRRFLAEWLTPEERQARRTVGHLFAASFSADGRIMASSLDQWVCVWDVEAGSLRRRIRFPNAHGCFLALSPDGQTVATSELMYAGDEGENTIRLYDTGTGELVLSLDPGDDRADVLAFSPDGTRLLTGFHRGMAVVWDVRRGPGTPRAKE